MVYMEDGFIIAGRRFGSRLFVGTGKYRSKQLMARCHAAAATEMVTLAVRRVNLTDRSKESELDFIDRSKTHILPNTASFLIVAATIAVPGYILGEVTLSFLGIGIQEPQASWGNMLTDAQSLRVLKSFPWMLIPGVFIFVTVLAYNFLGDGLADALNPRKVVGGKS